MQRNFLVANLIMFGAIFMFGTSASVLDFLWEGASSVLLQQKREENEDIKCDCRGFLCSCCYSDDGGPGCVDTRYFPQEKSLAVNMTFGGKVLESDRIKGANPEPPCMRLMSSIAVVCAKFFDLHTYKNGLRWCLSLESYFLGSRTGSFDAGCFTADPKGSKHDPYTTSFGIKKDDVESGEDDKRKEPKSKKEEQTKNVTEPPVKSVSIWEFLGLSTGNDEIDRDDNVTETKNTPLEEKVDTLTSWLDYFFD